MTEKEIFDRIVTIIQERQGEDFVVTESLSLNDDLDADSVDLMEFILTLEDEFSIEISDEEIEITAYAQGKNPNEIEVDRKGHLKPITVDYNIPSNISTPKVLVDLGNGIYRNLTELGFGNGKDKPFSIIPVIEKNAESCIIKVAIENDGIVLADFVKTYAVDYPIILRVSSPGPSTIRANENDYATISSIIFNDSRKQVTVNATWSTGKHVTITIPAQSSKTISETVHVTTNFTKDISLSLSTGEKAHSTINFQTFF